MLKLIGQALLAQHRVTGRVAVEEKPDVLWDRPDLERLYARLEDEYELKERGGALIPPRHARASLETRIPSPLPLSLRERGRTAPAILPR